MGGHVAPGKRGESAHGFMQGGAESVGFSAAVGGARGVRYRRGAEGDQASGDVRDCGVGFGERAGGMDGTEGRGCGLVFHGMAI